MKLTEADEMHAWALARVERETATVLSGATASRAALQKALTENENALRNLRHLRVRDQITDEEFASDRQALDTERLRLAEQFAEADPADAFEPAKLFVSFSNRALKWFREGDDETKRLILEITGSNPLLKDRELNIDARFPFRKWSRKRSFTELCSREESNLYYGIRNPVSYPLNDESFCVAIVAKD